MTTEQGNVQTKVIKAIRARRVRTAHRRVNIKAKKIIRIIRNLGSKGALLKTMKSLIHLVKYLYEVRIALTSRKKIYPYKLNKLRLRIINTHAKSSKGKFRNRFIQCQRESSTGMY